ncbi:MAG: OsmC family protein [Isosphaeraceae bacterium]
MMGRRPQARPRSPPKWNHPESCDAMNAEQLRAAQAPLKEAYKADPARAMRVLRAVGVLNPAAQTCTIQAGLGPEIVAGLHEAAGGDGRSACSGDMLLQSLAACAGVTLGAVSTALGIPVEGGRVIAEGELDCRGTLGVDRSVPVGISSIRLAFELVTEASDEQLANLIRLTERYCVIFQTLKVAPTFTVEVRRNSSASQ